MKKRLSSLFTIVIMLFTVMGPSTYGSEDLYRDRASGPVSDNKAYLEIYAKVDSVIKNYPISATLNRYLVENVVNKDDEQRSLWAAEIADDMSKASLFGLVKDDFLIIGGEAVKAYPHPLLLNNFGAMLMRKNPEDALFFLLCALDQEPVNPIFLANVANAYFELGDYGACERYIKAALASDDTYGPAYQLLTVMHLKNNNSELAAETMIKSVRDCFDDITQQQFDSFFSALGNLDYKTDEFPLRYEFLDLLIKYANEDNDMLPEGYNDFDTPAKQIRIKPFPKIYGAEDLRLSLKYIQNEIQKSYDRSNMVNSELLQYYRVSSETKAPKKQTSENTLSFEVQKNLRQEYAYKMVDTYYKFLDTKYEKVFLDKMEGITEQYSELESVLYENNTKRIEEAKKRAEQAANTLMAKLIASLSGTPLVNPESALEDLIAMYSTRVDCAQLSYELAKRRSEEVIDISQEWYNVSKQNLEEYWLKTGGLLKCFANSDRVFVLNSQRTMFIETFISSFRYLENEASKLKDLKKKIELEKMTLEQHKKYYSEMLSMKYEAEKKEVEEELKGEDTSPDIEKEGLKIYKEKNELDPIGFDIGLFGFGAAVSFDGENMNLTVSSPFGDIGGGYNFYDGSKFTYQTISENPQNISVYSVLSSIDPMWFLNSDVRGATFGSEIVQVAASKWAPVNALAKVGSVGLDVKTGTVSKGTYIKTDKYNNVIDNGTIKIKETGASALDFGFSKKTTVMHSTASGISTRKTTHNYQFMFATMSSSQR